ncbi:MAG: hypothetical protein KGH93_03305 [Patescibacteria group bacterium]|nr:hypothetical protein [Patescibacteria group bacterium]
MSIGGANYNDIIIPRNSKINYAVAGFAFSDTTQAGTFGVRKDGHLMLPTVVRTDAIGRDQFDAKTVSFEAELWQTNFTSLYNTYLLSKGLHQLQIELANGDWYNFIDNAGGLTILGGSDPPTGSKLVGMTFVYENTDKDLSMKAKWDAKMHPYEYDWLLANASSAAAGSSGGTSNSGMTAMAYDQSQYGIPGFKDILFGSDSVGVLGEGSKISLSFKEMSKTIYQQPITRLVQVDAEIVMQQSVIADLQAVTALRNSDFTTTFKLWNGTTLSFVNSLSVVDAPDFNDQKTFNKLTLKGIIPYDKHDTETNIVWTAGTSTVQFNRIGY